MSTITCKKGDWATFSRKGVSLVGKIVLIDTALNDDVYFRIALYPFTDQVPKYVSPNSIQSKTTFKEVVLTDLKYDYEPFF